VDSLLSEPWTENDSSESFLLLLPPSAGVESFSFNSIDLNEVEERRINTITQKDKTKQFLFYL
jgi:hypothetical protein